MGRKTFAAELTSEQRDELNTKIELGSETVDDLLAWVKSVAPEVPASRSSVGRYAFKVRTKQRVLESFSEKAQKHSEVATEEIIELMIELANARMKEAAVLDRLRELQAI